MRQRKEIKISVRISKEMNKRLKSDADKLQSKSLGSAIRAILERHYKTGNYYEKQKGKITTAKTKT